MEMVRACTITGKKFVVSQLEQQLRASFHVEPPDIHPYERMRYLMCFRNIHSLSSDICDLCGKATLSIWGDNPVFPVYCRACWYSDAWAPPKMEVNLDRPFFDQFKELCAMSPHPAVAVDGTIVNSDYCNSVTSLSNCYMTFSSQKSEDCYYCYGCYEAKQCIDVNGAVSGEILYEALACDQSYRVFWSEYAIHCMDSFLLYDCVDCSNCCLSSGLRHKQYVYNNEQLTKEAYEQKIADLARGSYAVVEQYRVRFSAMKKNHPKKDIIGRNNENVRGNILVNCKDIEEGYGLTDCERCANTFNCWTVKDCLDVCTFGGNTERCFASTSVGNNSSDIRYSWSCYGSCSSIEYSALCISSNNCFGCAFGRKFEYAILNTPYSKDEYENIVSLLKEKMKERGEYGRLFPPDLIPFAYNESIAQMNMPLTQEEARARGFRWVEKPIPVLPPEKIFSPPDSIHDVSWKDLEGKVIVCKDSSRPYKIIKQEFEFYKKYGIPLPRLHGEVRMARRYPRELMYHLHEAQCSHCHAKVATSMPTDETILCEECYQKQVV